MSNFKETFSSVGIHLLLTKVSKIKCETKLKFFGPPFNALIYVLG